MTSVSLSINPKSILGTLARWAAELRKIQFVATKEEVLQHITLFPIGAPLFWLTETPPEKHIALLGQRVYVNDYKKLFAVYGYTFGFSATGDQFDLPDMRGRYPFGQAISGTGSTLRGTFGAKDMQPTPAVAVSVPAHKHGKGTLNIPAGAGSHSHAYDDYLASPSGAGNGTLASTAIAAAALWGHVTKAATHAHPNSEFSGSVGATAGEDGDAAFNATVSVTPPTAVNPPSITGLWITRYDD